VFITAYGNRITTGITDLALQLKVPVIKYNRLLRQGARTLFDTDAFDLNAYAPGPEFFLSDQKIALGKRLFSDPMISGTGTRSCASCHQPGKAFTDGLKKNTVIGGHAPLKRNTPTLLNAALQPSLFYDLRVNTLEDQVHEVVQDKQEMDGSITAVAHRLWQNKDYRRLFEKAFPEKGRTGIDTFEVMNAIASYVRSLSRLNSRFDAYMRGDKTALDTEEVRGFNLFMGKAKCGTCHYMPLFNGTLPPKYFASDAEVIGVPASPADTAIDPDPGWFNIIGIASFKHAFKIPTVRNAARTAPYMHNGVFATLEDVMDFYNDGGGAGHGLRVANQTLSSDSLHLTQTEIKEVIAFIKSLNSR
jgi:cytochrome c peroxidase